MYKIIYFTILLFAISSCKNDSSSNGESFLLERLGSLTDKTIDEIDVNEDNIKILDIENSIIDTMLLSSIIDTIYHVDLETNKESILGSISKVVCVDSLIYVMDAYKIVKCFNRQGKYLHTVFDVGEGPEDVARPYDFDADKKGVYVLDGARVRMLTFDHVGKFVSAKYIPYRVTNFKIMDDNTFIFHLTPFNEHFKTLQGYRCVIADTNFVPIKKFYKDIQTERIVRTPFFSGNYFSPIIRDVIYHLGQDKLEVSYKLNFGKYTLSIPKDVERIYLSELADEGLMYVYKNTINNYDYILQYLYTRGSGYSLFINTCNNSYVVVKDIINDRNDIINFNMLNVLGSNLEKNEFIMRGITLDRKSVDKQILESINKKLSSSAKSILLKDGDSNTEPNGVLTFFKLKKDIDFNLFLRQ